MPLDIEMLILMLPAALIAALVCIVIKTSADGDRNSSDPP